MLDYSIGHIIYFPDAFAVNGPGAWVVTSRDEILHAPKDRISIYDVGNGKAEVANYQLDHSKCSYRFMDRFIDMRTHSYTYMLGAICGDVAGSVYEHHNIKYLLDADALIHNEARFTDDSVLTLGIAEGIKNAMKRLNKTMDFTEADDPVFLAEIATAARKWGTRYPYAGYGRGFRAWLFQPDAGPYGSNGNGSAMRASYAGWVATTLADAEYLAGVSARISHDSPEGIKGARAVAGSIFLLKQYVCKNESDERAKQAVRDYVSKLYSMDFTLDEIRPSYHFDSTCEGSVPMAIEAFLEGNSFSEVLSLAISIGGDSDTIAAIAGSLAEAIYPIPDDIRDKVLEKLDYDFKSELAGVIDYMIITLNRPENNRRFLK